VPANGATRPKREPSAALRVRFLLRLAEIAVNCQRIDQAENQEKNSNKAQGFLKRRRHGIKQSEICK
jgi:hypothetical protein